ncbi:hypothetical protein [Streptomyces sp. NPDC086023]|uniref:hypothetical protein n=1 Tax=Streptomyces sp. NPDC086023 TaxID=3365746 RepID=UPI0037D4CF61
MGSQLSSRRTAMFVIPVCAGLLLGGLAATPAHAATINVACNTTALTNAVNQANANPDSTTLRLARGCVYTYTAGDPSASATALPHVTTRVVFDGRDSTITRAEDAPLFRLLAIEASGEVELKDLTLSNGDIVNNGGGAIANGGTLTISNSRIVGNTVRSQNGGAIANSGSLRITASLLRDNSVVIGPNPGGGGGGAITNGVSGVVRVDASVLTGNTAFRDGGAIANSGTFTITGGLLTGNEGRAGGAIANGGDFTLTGAVLTHNTATLTNGGAITNGGTLTTRLLAVTHNTAAIDGGGIVNSGTLNARSTRVESNTAATGTGGGIVNRGGTAEATLTDSRVTRNAATQAPAGIHNDGGLVTLNNTSVTNNTPGNCAGSLPAIAGCTG